MEQVPSQHSGSGRGARNKYCCSNPSCEQLREFSAYLRKGIPLTPNTNLFEGIISKQRMHLPRKTRFSNKIPLQKGQSEKGPGTFIFTQAMAWFIWGLSSSNSKPTQGACRKVGSPGIASGRSEAQMRTKSSFFVGLVGKPSPGERKDVWHWAKGIPLSSKKTSVTTLPTRPASNWYARRKGNASAQIGCSMFHPNAEVQDNFGQISKGSASICLSCFFSSLAEWMAQKKSKLYIYH